MWDSWWSIPMTIPMTAVNPSYVVQQCPVCSGTRGETRSYGWVDCSFCWGVGAVKVGWLSGAVEAVEPPAEPRWHREKREASAASPADAAEPDAGARGVSRARL